MNIDLYRKRPSWKIAIEPTISRSSFYFQQDFLEKFPSMLLLKRILCLKVDCNVINGTMISPRRFKNILNMNILFVRRERPSRQRAIKLPMSQSRSRFDRLAVSHDMLNTALALESFIQIDFSSIELGSLVWTARASSF